eukprot:COSAG05_NODE_147_length_16383_cov_266.102555_27_plen_78_part_00
MSCVFSLSFLPLLPPAQAIRNKVGQSPYEVAQVGGKRQALEFFLSLQPALADAVVAAESPLVAIRGNVLRRAARAER